MEIATCLRRIQAARQVHPAGSLASASAVHAELELTDPHIQSGPYARRGGGSAISAKPASGLRKEKAKMGTTTTTTTTREGGVIDSTERLAMESRVVVVVVVVVWPPYHNADREYRCE